MRDMLPRKSGTVVTDLKKGLKESLFSNGMNPSTSPGLRSPTTSGESSSPAQEPNEAPNFKNRSESPNIMKNNDEKSINSTSNCVSAMMTNSIASNIAATPSTKVMSPLSSPGIMPIVRMKSPSQTKQYKARRTEARQKNQIFDFDSPRHEGQSSSENFCANNNNNSKHRDKSPFNLRRVCMKPDDQMRTCRTPSTNSASDMSPSSLTMATDDHTATPCEQNFDQIGEILGDDDALYVDDKTMQQALNDIDVPGVNPGLTLDDFPDAGGDLGLDGVTTSDFTTTSETFLFGGSDMPRTSQADLSPLDGAGFVGSVREQISPTSGTKVSSSSTVTTATCAVTQAMHGILTSSASSLASSVSSPSFQPDPTSRLTTTSPFHPKFSPPEGANTPNQSGKSQSGKSHLQDILGVTDTIRLQNMSRPIDSVAYKSPTTTSYSASVKPHPIIPSSPCSMAPPPQHRLPTNVPYRPRQPFMYNDNRPNIRGGVPPYMDMGVNWSRDSPGQVGTSPSQLRSPTFPPTFVDTSVSPTNVNPMSGLQSTVDSIPAAPLGTSEPSTPVMGPPLLRSPHSYDGTPPPGGRMRPPPSPSMPNNNDKRCVSVDSVATPTTTSSKKSVNKRERTRSADSREDEKKETSGPKTKRRKSRSKEDSGGKKGEGKALTRTNSKIESRLSDSALGGLLDVQTNNPFLYIFNSEVANTATDAVLEKKVPDIILFHQSFLGNCKLGPSRPQTSTFERPLNAPPSVSMPTMSRSPTEIKMEKREMASPRTEIPMSFSENIPASINLQDSKPPNMMPHIGNDIGRMSNPDIFPPRCNAMQPLNGEQELTAEKRKHREDKLSKLQNMKEMLLRKDEPNGGNNIPRGPGWHGPHPHMNYPMSQHPDKMHPGMKEGIMTPEGMLPGQPMTQEHADWLNLLQQEYNTEKQKRKEGELPTRPPPPYHLNGAQQRWMSPEGYPIDPRLPMDPRFQRLPPGHRPMGRVPHDPRMPGGYPRMAMARAPYPPNSRMPMYDPYMVQQSMMGPRGPPISTRLPPSGIRQPGVNETYPFSEQLMKQASYYNREGGIGYEQDPAMMGDWPGNGPPDGTQRLSHMPGATSPSVMGPNMMNPMEMDARLTPVDIRVPNPHGYEMGPYHDVHRFGPCTIGSPTGPMDVRLRGPAVVGSMVDAMARRGGQRPPDLNLNSQLTPRSPMNYHVRGPLPSPNVMTTSMGPRYPNPGDMGHHPPQPSPLHGGQRSPMQSPPHPQYMPMGPTSSGMDQPQVMLGAGPHSAGMMTNPPADWHGPSPNMPPGTPTSNPTMMHHMMSSQPGMVLSQPRMMVSQPGVMTSEPMMMSQQGMPHQHMMNNRHPNAGNKHGPSTLSIMMNRMNTFKMPEKSPLYQEAVKDTASPPPLNHPEPPPLSHNAMPGGMRMVAPGHPPSYDSRMGPPRMGGPPGPQMNDSFQGYPPGHPSPLQGPPMSVGNNMMSIPPDSMPPPSDYPGRPGFHDMQGFDLRGILPSERPSQTISYLPPEPNEPYNPGWGGEGIRPQLMPSGPMYPPAPNNRPLI